MFKKTLVLSMAVALMLMGLCTVASAAQNVANTSQKGSLLIFPGVFTDLSEGVDTIIQIGNDASEGTTIKCLWMNADQLVWDLEFPITANQPVWFRASDGTGSSQTNVNGAGPDFIGELKCFAITIPVTSDNETQISFNHLYGSALIVQPSNALAFEYNAWAFTAHNAYKTAVGTPGQMLLTGGTGAVYDACPAYLIYNFWGDGGNATIQGQATGNRLVFGDSILALSPCYEDFRQERVPTCTKVKFDIWNENERKLTGAYRCIKCWLEVELDDLDDPAEYPAPNPSDKPAGYGGDFFTFGNLHTASGRFRATGISGGSVCEGVFLWTDDDDSIHDYCPRTAQVNIPFVGLLATEVGFRSPTSFRPAIIATTGNTAGAWTGYPKAGWPTPTILWDPAGGPLEAPGK